MADHRWIGSASDPYARAMAMYAQGQSVWTIGRAFGISGQTMWTILKRRGVQFRPKGQGGSWRAAWATRFAERILPEPNSGCWLWTGALFNHGYGCVVRNGQHTLAHRIAYELWCGAIPPDLFVCHHCDVPPCVNPAHLFLGTAHDNAQDASRKGRYPDRHGLRNGHHKLTPTAAATIRTLAQAGQSPATIAKRFGVGPTAVRDVLRGKTWRV